MPIQDNDPIQGNGRLDLRNKSLQSHVKTDTRAIIALVNHDSVEATTELMESIVDKLNQRNPKSVSVLVELVGGPARERLLFQETMNAVVSLPSDKVENEAERIFASQPNGPYIMSILTGFAKYLHKNPSIQLTFALTDIGDENRDEMGLMKTFEESYRAYELLVRAPQASVKKEDILTKAKTCIAAELAINIARENFVRNDILKAVGDKHLTIAIVGHNHFPIVKINDTSKFDEICLPLEKRIIDRFNTKTSPLDISKSFKTELNKARDTSVAALTEDDLISFFLKTEILDCLTRYASYVGPSDGKDYIIQLSALTELSNALTRAMSATQRRELFDACFAEKKEVSDNKPFQHHVSFVVYKHFLEAKEARLGNDAFSCINALFDDVRNNH